MRALLDAGEHRIVELLSERDRLSSNADHDRLLREQAIAARDAAQAARDELSSALTKNVQLEDQIESLVTANKRASDDIQRARAVEKKRLDEIARLESMLRNKDDAQSASLLWQRKYDDLTATMEKAHADLDAVRGENTQIRTELQVQISVILFFCSIIVFITRFVIAPATDQSFATC
jgi:chromosome segregation ATPase